MLSSISLTFNFAVAQPFDEDRLLTQITAAVQAAVQSHTQAQNPSEGALAKDESGESFKSLADENQQRLEKKEVTDEGWGEVHDLAGFIGRLPKNQKKVVLQAIENGGQVSRSEVFALIGRSENKSLKGFTKPVARKMEELQDKKELPLDAAPLLRPIYDGSSRYQQAQGFTVPMQVVVRMRGDLGDAVKH